MVSGDDDAWMTLARKPFGACLSEPSCACPCRARAMFRTKASCRARDEAAPAPFSRASLCVAMIRRPARRRCRASRRRSRFSHSCAVATSVEVATEAAGVQNWEAGSSTSSTLAPREAHPDGVHTVGPPLHHPSESARCAGKTARRRSRSDVMGCGVAEVCEFHFRAASLRTSGRSWLRTDRPVT